MIDKELLDILVCPECRKDIIECEKGLLCRECKVIYPVREGIPVMLKEETIKYEGDE